MFTANGTPLSEVRLTLPLTGNITADISIPQGGALISGNVDLRVGSLVIRGTAFRSGERGIGRYALISGGNGGLSRTLAAQAFRQMSLSALLSGLLSEVGETLAPDGDSAALATFAPHWVRLAQTAAEQVQAIAAAAGRNWRVRPDGSVWVGEDLFPVAPSGGTLMDEWPEQGKRLYGTLEPSMLPGTTIDGWPIATVEHFANAKEIRTVVYRA